MPILVATNYEKTKFNIEVDKYPDVCPVCKTGNEFTQLYAYYKTNQFGESPRLQVVFRCPRQDCQILFFVFYHDRWPMHHRGYGGETTLQMQQFGFTEYVKEQTFPDPIPTMSPRFLRIHFQASMADENGMDEVSGLAYGKALEFLIKDYLIHMNPKQEEDIKNQLKLGVLIDQLDDPDLEAVAKRAAWLRNDEAHYVRKWEDKDIEDLKKLIELTVSYIRRAYLTGKYKTEMPDPKEQKTEEKQNSQKKQ